LVAGETRLAFWMLLPLAVDPPYGSCRGAVATNNREQRAYSRHERFRPEVPEGKRD
jgi:hypothetical protein